jgi:Protein of unknown function (DUF2510)
MGVFREKLPNGDPVDEGCRRESMDEVAGKQPVPDQEEGWFPDPEQEGQERFWDGEAWTDEVRPDGSGDTRLTHLPEHVPELQRALAAATADIDSVEDRLSTLFDRSGGASGQGPPRPRPARGPRLIAPEALEQHDGDADGDGDDAADDDDDLLLEDFDEEPAVFEDEDDELDAAVDGDDEEEDEDDGFADLDAALASESPEDL